MLNRRLLVRLRLRNIDQLMILVWLYRRFPSLLDEIIIVKPGTVLRWHRRWVAMESSGVYWKPVWPVLEGEFELVLANAAHLKSVPGRKRDVNDASWIEDLLGTG